MTQVPGAGLAGEVWVCASADAGIVAKRIRIDTDLAGASFAQDPAVNYAYASPSGPAGYPSSTCQSTVFHVREINALVGPYRVWLYTWQDGASRAQACYRVANADASLPTAGGLLTLDTTGIVQAGVDASSDFSPCPENELTLSNPPIVLRHSRGAAAPAWVCVQAGTTYRRVSLNTLSGGGPVRLTRDP